MCRKHDAGLCGVAQMFFPVLEENDRSVTAKSAIKEQFLDLRRVVGGDDLKIISSVNPGPCEGHTVLRKGSCLIGTDDRSASQRLHCGKAADNGVVLNHPLYTDGKDNGNDRRKPFRDSRYCKGDSNHKDLKRRHTVYKTDGKNDGASAKADIAEDLT